MKSNKRKIREVKSKTKSSSINKASKSKKALKETEMHDRNFNRFKNFGLFEDVFRLW